MSFSKSCRSSTSCIVSPCAPEDPFESVSDKENEPSTVHTHKKPRVIPFTDLSNMEDDTKQSTKPASTTSAQRRSSRAVTSVTPSPPPPVSAAAAAAANTRPLKGVIVFVDVNDDELKSQLEEQLKELGAEKQKSMGAKVTHIVWSDGNPSTLHQYNKIPESRRLVMAVIQPSWVEACVRACEAVSEFDHVVDVQAALQLSNSAQKNKNSNKKTQKQEENVDTKPQEKIHRDALESLTGDKSNGKSKKEKVSKPPKPTVSRVRAPNKPNPFLDDQQLLALDVHRNAQAQLTASPTFSASFEPPSSSPLNIDEVPVVTTAKPAQKRRRRIVEEEEQEAAVQDAAPAKPVEEVKAADKQNGKSQDSKAVEPPSRKRIKKTASDVVESPPDIVVPSFANLGKLKIVSEKVSPIAPLLSADSPPPVVADNKPRVSSTESIALLSKKSQFKQDLQKLSPAKSNKHDLVAASTPSDSSVNMPAFRKRRSQQLDESTASDTATASAATPTPVAHRKIFHKAPIKSVAASTRTAAPTKSKFPSPSPPSDSSSSASQPRRSSRKPSIIQKPKPNTITTSSMSVDNKELVLQAINSLNKFEYVKDAQQPVSHLVVERPSRTMKLLQSISVGGWVLRYEWAIKSMTESNRFLSEADYEITEFPGCRLSRLAHTHREKLVLHGHSVYVTSGVEPSKQEIEQLAVNAGATLVDSFSDCTICLSTDDHSTDDFEVDPSKQSQKKPSVVTTKWLFTTLSEWKLQPTGPYTIFQDEEHAVLNCSPDY